MAGSRVTKDDRVWRRLREKVRGIGKARVKVGVIGAGVHQGGIAMAELAAIHEFGAPKANIPERSFLRRTFSEDEGRHQLGSFTAKLARELLAEKIDVPTALGQLGAKGAAMVKARIKMGIWPPIRPATVARKGSSGILIDTGAFVNSITFQVAK